MNTPLGEPVLLHASHGASMGRLRTSECFVSRQGEGLRTGTPSYFIRLSGCNLRCWFCDTPYASWRPERNWTAVDRVVSDVIAAGVGDVVITGGEPMLQPAIVPLTRVLRDAGLFTTIETAGTIDRPVACDLMSISPKLSGSGPRPGSGGEDRWRDRHERTRWQPQVISRLIERGADYQVKFVVDQPEDVDAVTRCVSQLPGVQAANVWLMPQAADLTTLEQKALWLQPAAARAGYHYCDRSQLRWYGNRRGT